MARVVIKIGDIFEARLDESSKKYFQVIAFDATQLSSSVIRAFKRKYTSPEKPNFKDIIRDEVDFYAHCSAKLGLKLNLWQKIGNIAETGKLNNILFRGTSDYGRKLGEEPVKVSNKWYVWKINDEKFTRVGILAGENQKAEIGLVFTPHDIIDRLRTGEYNLRFYPGY
jgi:hypothetical protein